MISPRTVGLILATLASLECVQGEPRFSFLVSLAAVLAIVIAWCLLAKGLAWRITIRRPADQRMPKFESWRRRLDTAWIAIYPIALTSLDWADWARYWSVERHLSSLALGMLFLPHLLAAALIEMTAAQAEQAGNPGDGSRQVRWMHLWRMRMRLGEPFTVVVCLAPLFFFSTAHDALASGVFGQTSWSWKVGVGLLTLTLFLSLFPIFVGRFIGARDFRNRQWSQRIADLWRACGIRSPALREVPSDGRWAGAAVVGWIPGMRQLWLGDALMEVLTERELEMVILHELAHVKRRHFWWRAVPIVWSAGVAAFVFAACSYWTSLLPEWVPPILSMVLSTVFLLLGTGAASRDCEFDADRTACELAVEVCPWVRGDLQSAVATLGTALCKLTGTTNSSRQRSWLHPSLHERLGSLANHLAAARKSAGSDRQFVLDVR